MTPAQLKTEIETGPLANAMAADWQARRTGAVAAALNAKTVTIPAPAPMYFVDLFGLIAAGQITPASFVKVWLHPRFQQFYDDVMNGNHYAVQNLYPAAWQSDGTLQAAEAVALATYAARLADTPANRMEVLAGMIGAAVTIAEVDSARAI